MNPLFPFNRKPGPTIAKLRSENATLKEQLAATQDERDFLTKLIYRQQSVLELTQANVDRALAQANT